MRFGAFAIVVCSVGCAKIEAEFEDPGTPVTVLENGFERRVVGPNYTMVFHGGGANEVHMPESLQIAGSEVLSTDNPDDRFERLVGFGVFPPLIATADTDGVVVSSDITTNDDGPFVAQISTTFAIDYTCEQPVGTKQFKATSIFTFFPNGRIVRHDTEVQAVADGDTLANVANVSCTGRAYDGNGEIIITSFWAFEGLAGDTVNRAGEQIVQPGNNRDLPGACTLYPTHSLGARYEPMTTRVALNNTSTDAHVFDFVPMGTTSVGSTKFDELVSQVQLRNQGGLPCSELLGQLDEPAIRVGDEEVPSQNFDGIYEDPFNPRDEAYDVEVIGSTAVPAGWVLATEPSSDTIRITREDGSEPDYNVQRLEVGLTRMLIIFNEPLEPGQKITIEPL